ncbi:MAG TPA: sulfotransferase, partial [Rubrobacteraceae bacterium]|nr:sulfotransferase [Rubrobacteraceae bacterium]
MTEEELLRSSIEHLHGPEEVAYGDDELVVVTIVRDGRPYVRSFVEHYFSMSAKHIAFLDNNSADGTVEALRNYDNVTVLGTELPYKATGATTGNSWTREVLFKQYMISRFGKKNRWCLCVDIDELFDYPYSDVVGLATFLRYLNSKSYTAVAAQMLDMFSGEPLTDQADNLDVPLKELHSFYDISNIDRRPMRRRAHRRNNTLGNKEIESFSGGILDSIFGTSPYLTKFPLVFSDGKVKPMDGSSHRISNAAIADLTCVLLHYKFLDKYFHAQVSQAVQEEHRLRNSAIYKRYMEVLDSNPNLEIKRETSRELGGVNDLLENGFLLVSDDYLSWVNAEEEKSVSRTSRDEPRHLVDTLLDSRRREREKTLKIQRLQWQLREEGVDPRGQRGKTARDNAVATAAEADKEAALRRGAESGEESIPGSQQSTITAPASRTPASELSEQIRPLFIAGCARSGTTALTDYLNLHPEILVCQERYKTGVSTKKITRVLFSFERILDFRPEELERPPWPVERYVKYHAEVLAKKDPAKLRWIGDKGPWYVRYMDVLTENNPGARFIVLYRPLEEVAESWNARAKVPDDPWRSERGVEVAVETWNAAMRKTREFIEANPTPRVLIVSYHDFFYRNEAVVPQISRFLGVDFEESVIGAWRRSSTAFEGTRRRKEPLDEEHRSFIQEHADRGAEAWVLDRIEKQWEEPRLYVEDSREAALASLQVAEAKMWQLQQEATELERSLTRERRRG